MNRTIFAALLLSLGFTAHAGGNIHNHHNTTGDTYNGPVDSSTTNAATGVGIGTASSEATSNSTAVSGSYSQGGAAVSLSQGGTSGAVSGASSAGQTNSMSVNNRDRLQAPAVVAPALTSGNDTCMGSSSVGGSGPGFGFSVGSTWSDEHCRMLKSASILFNLGKEDAALARVCMDAMNREALESTGYKCPTPKTVAATPAGLPPYLTSAD